MQIIRMSVPCRSCQKPVGFWVNVERYATPEEQYEGTIPLCPECGDIVATMQITARKLSYLRLHPTKFAKLHRNYIARRARGFELFGYGLEYIPASVREIVEHLIAQRNQEILRTDG